MKWEPIETAPKDGTEIIVLIDCASVEIVRTAWYDDETDTEAEPGDRGWWSYRHSVTQELLDEYEQPIAWLPLPENTREFVK